MDISRCFLVALEVAAILAAARAAPASTPGGRPKEDKAAAQPADPKVTIAETKGRCGFAGRVIDAETGKPVEKFAMHVGSTPKPEPDLKKIPWFVRYSGGRHRGGRFRISSSLPDDRQQFVYFCILADGYVPQLISDKPLFKPLTYEGVVVRLRRGASIAGRVLDHTGQPVAGANVFLVSRLRRLALEDGKPEDFAGSTGKTDKDGRFKVPGASEMTSDVVVSCKLLHAWIAKIPAAGEELTIKLPAPATVVFEYDIPGAVTDHVRVCLATWEMPRWKGRVSDIVLRPKMVQASTVTLKNLTPGVYDVARVVRTRVGDTGGGAFCNRQKIEVKSGQRRRIRFVRRTGAAIVGDIPGLAANGCEGAYIRVEETTVGPDTYSSLGHTVLDAVACGPDGRFKTSRIQPGRYNVTATAYVIAPPSRMSTGIRAPTFAGSAEVTVPATGQPVPVRVLMGPRQPAKAPEAPATAAALERCWGDLATVDYVKGSRAAAALAAGGDEAAKYLTARLSAPPADPARMKKLIGQLDSPQHKVRGKAQADLKALGMAALPGLRAAAKGDLSTEGRTRIEAMLAREPALLMRMERGLDVLAKLDRPQCLQVLRKLAKGDPSAPQTKLAKARLQALLAEPADPAAGVSALREADDDVGEGGWGPTIRR